MKKGFVCSVRIAILKLSCVQGVAMNTNFGAINQIESDLRSLSVETRKKFPELKNAAERAILQLRHHTKDVRRAVESKDSGAPDMIRQVLGSDYVLRPFLRACETKNPKLTVLALTSIQRLLGSKAVQAAFIPTVVGQLRMAADSGDETVQLKILQTLVLAVSTDGNVMDASAVAVSLVDTDDSAATGAGSSDDLQVAESSRVVMHNQDSLLQALGICFRLYGVKSRIIHHTAFATLRQVVALMYDRVTSRILRQLPESENSPVVTSVENLDAAKARFQQAEARKGLQETPDVAAAAHVRGKGASAGGTAVVEYTEFDALTPHEQHAFLLFRDLFMIARGEAEKMTWLQVSADVQLPAGLGVELLESIISSNQVLFAHRPVFARMLSRELCPLLARMLRAEEAFPLVLRVTRVVLVLIRYYHRVMVAECEMFMSMLVRLLEPEFAMWRRVMALESIKTLCHDSDILLFFFVSFDQKPPATKIFGSIGHALGRFVHQASLDTGGGSTLHNQTDAQALLWHINHGRGKGLDLLNETVPPDYGELHAVSLAVESLIAIVNVLSGLEKASAASGPNAGQEVTGKAVEEKADVTSSSETPFVASRSNVAGMANTAWAPVLTALQFLLSHTEEEALLQHLLLSFQSFTNTSGLLGLTKARDMFLAALCRFALPAEASDADHSYGVSYGLDTPVTADQKEPELSPKNIQALKALFNIAHCLGGILGSSWLQVLQTFEHLDSMIQHQKDLLRPSRGPVRKSGTIAKLKDRAKSAVGMDRSTAGHGAVSSDGSFRRAGGRQPTAEELEEDSRRLDELSILEAALSRLFESTRYLDNKAIKDVLSALGTMSLAALANAATGNDSVEKDKLLDAQPTTPTKGGITVPRTPSPTPTPSTPNHSKSGTSESPLRMFALTNLVQTIQHNMFRLVSASLWEIAIGHLNCVINHRVASVRQIGVDALCRLTIQALGRKVTQDGAASKEHYQQYLLEPLSALWRSKYSDARDLILDALFEILQSSGQTLREGWPTILLILQSVARGTCDLNWGQLSADGTAQSSSASAFDDTTRDEADSAIDRGVRKEFAVQSSPKGSEGKFHDRAAAHYVGQGFRSMELIVNDFLEYIRFDDLSMLIDAVGWFCRQTHHTNISFTSTGLLWRISDHLQKVAGVRPNRPKDTEDGSQDMPNSSPAGPRRQSSSGDGLPVYEMEVLSSDKADELMRAVFLQLSFISTDLRSEVRNSAVKTLQSTLVAHGGRMTPTSWHFCLESVLFPLLVDLLTMNRQSASESSKELGKERGTGKSVMMLVHYSRDTAEKQWNETRVIALQGSARVFRQYLPTLSVMSSFSDQWQAYLHIIRASIAHNSSEVALAGIAAIQDVLESPATAAICSTHDSLWAAVLRLYTGTVQKAQAGAQLLVDYLEKTPTEETARSSSARASDTTPTSPSDPSALSKGKRTPSGSLVMPADAVMPQDAEEMVTRWTRWCAVYKQLVVSFEVLLRSCHRLFDPAHVALILRLVHALVNINTEVEARLHRIMGRTPSHPVIAAVKSRTKFTAPLPSKESALQVSALQLLSSLNHMPPMLWHSVLSQITEYIKRKGSISLASTDRTEEVKTSRDAVMATPVLSGLSESASAVAAAVAVGSWVKPLSADVTYPSGFSMKAMDALVAVVSTGAPPEVVLSHLDDIVWCLWVASGLVPQGYALQSENRSSHRNTSEVPVLDVELAVHTTRSLLKVLRQTLPWLNRAHISQHLRIGSADAATLQSDETRKVSEAPDSRRLWQIISDALETLLKPLPHKVQGKFAMAFDALYGPKAKRPMPPIVSPTLQHHSAWHTMQKEVVLCVVESVLPQSYLASAEQRWRILQLLTPVSFARNEPTVSHGDASAARAQPQASGLGPVIDAVMAAPKAIGAASSAGAAAVQLTEVEVEQQRLGRILSRQCLEGLFSLCADVSTEALKSESDASNAASTASSVTSSPRHVPRSQSGAFPQSFAVAVSSNGAGVDGEEAALQAALLKVQRSTHVAVGKTAIALLLARCKATIVALLSSERRASDKSQLPVELLEDALSVMQLLLATETSREVVEVLFEENARLLELSRAGGSKWHVVKLLPVLSDCVLLEDIRIRKLVQQLLHVCARCMSLE